MKKIGPLPMFTLAQLFLRVSSVGPEKAILLENFREKSKFDRQMTYIQTNIYMWKSTEWQHQFYVKIPASRKDVCRPGDSPPLWMPLKRRSFRSIRMWFATQTRAAYKQITAFPYRKVVCDLKGDSFRALG